jgi:hypothetical protein
MKKMIIEIFDFSLIKLDTVAAAHDALLINQN